MRDLDPSELPRADSPCRQPEVVWVKDVIDGDTLKIEGKWGGESVRMTGINAPEMDWNQQNHDCWAEEARAALEEAVLEKWVWLSFDQECEDNFDRTLAYVHRGVDIEGFVQRSLLREGHVQAYKVNPNNHFASLFSADESYAEREELGQWKSCP